ncbi:MAG TPA: GNAT family N-acetyltransferase [Streptosporangiaceae bacterium]|nr:GNAT family N-acetyltransferase [Streptosporangiaceae bacterium]
MIGVIRAEPGDAAALSAVIAEAFFDLPPSRWLISDEASRRRIFPAYFRIFVEHALANEVVHTTPDRAAAALWLSMGELSVPAPDNYAERLREVTAPWTSRFIEFDAALESRHLIGAAHHHLALLGVRPGQQGRGIGTALLRAHHRLLDQAGVAAYLEASSQRTRRLYERHGYSDLGPPICLPDGPQMFPMIRQPHPAAPRPGNATELGAQAADSDRQEFR